MSGRLIGLAEPLGDHLESATGITGPVSSSAARSHRRGQAQTPLGAAVIGLGVGQQHVVGFQRPGECEVVAVCDLSADKSQRITSQMPNVTATRCWRELLDDDRVNIVSIASYDDAHFEQTLAALQAQRHVFVEKPLCRSRQELRQLKQALQNDHRLQLRSNLVLRAAPVYRWLRYAIQIGTLGEIYAFDGDYLFGRIEKITTGWRKEVDHYSVMQGGGVHLVDLMLWLTGQLPVRVSALGNRIATQGTPFRYHDFAAATFAFPSGLVGRITANFGCVQPHQHFVRVFGTKGTFVYDDQGPRWFTSRDPQVPASRLEMSPLPPSKWALIPEFIDDILSDKGHSQLAQREFDTMSVCFAADEAIETGTLQEIVYE